MKDMQTLTKADINSKHKLLIAKICTRLKEIKKLGRGRPRWNVENLTCIKTESARCSTRKPGCSGMWKWKCGSAVEQYPEICVRVVSGLVGKVNRKAESHRLHRKDQ
jgi:hypothetical protein